MVLNRRAAALELAEMLLEQIELSSIAAPEQLLRASRLARLLDDTEALAWLSYEITGYELETDGLSHEAYAAATRSGRRYYNKEVKADRVKIASVAQLQANIDAGMVQLAAATDAPVSVSSANPSQFVTAPQGNTRERSSVRDFLASQRDLLSKICGALHQYVSEKHTELRFGAAVESAFDNVRRSVDGKVAELAPSASIKFASAFENAASDNPEDWANAAGACRRLIKAVADELRPPGDPVNKILMTDDKYINRLVDWISNQQAMGGTSKEVMRRDLEHLGTRLDAFSDAGHKGAHAEVTKYEASRFIAGTYLLIGDVLQLKSSNEQVALEEEAPQAEEASVP